MDYMKRDSEVLRRSCFSYLLSLDIILTKISKMIDRIQDYSWISREVYLMSRAKNTPKTDVDIRVYRSVTDFMNKIMEVFEKAVERYQVNIDILSGLYKDQTGKDPNEILHSEIDPSEVFNKSLAVSLTENQLKEAGSNIKKVMRLVEYHAENLITTLSGTVSDRLILTKGEVEVSEDSVRNLKDCIRLIKHIYRKYEITFDTFKEDHPEEERRVARDKLEQKREKENRRKAEQQKYYQYYYSQHRGYGKTYEDTEDESKSPQEKRLEESYRILNLSPKATFEEVKKAYKSLIKKYHPDKYPNDEYRRKNAEEFTRLLNKAYEELESYFGTVK